MKATATSTLTVDLLNYSLNLERIRGRIPTGCDIMAVVKADAYGLGAVPIAKRAVEEGVSMLGVASVQEGVALREADIEAPILVLVQPSDAQLGDAVEHKLRLAVSDYRTAERLGDVARKAKTVASVHCEIDTGMGRQGFAIASAAEELRSLTRISNVDVEGVFTHFASADDTSDPFTESQIRQFRKLLKQLDKDGIPYEVAHAANSAAVINFPQGAFDMVRVGLFTYGVWPGEAPCPDDVIEQVASWRTQVVLLRDVPGGASISYGRTFRAPGPLKVAAIPVGYADGYRTSLSNQGEVLVRGKRCPVRGRVTMNETMIDVSKVRDVAVGDTVTLLGQVGSEAITAKELADRSGAIPYEILTGIGPAVAREYKL